MEVWVFLTGSAVAGHGFWVSGLFGFRALPVTTQHHHRNIGQKSTHGGSSTGGSLNGRISSGSPSLFHLCQTRWNSGPGSTGVDPPENRSPSPNLPQSLGVSLPISQSHLSLSFSPISALSPSMSLSVSCKPEEETKNRRRTKMKEEGRVGCRF
jgi:hypothetical protein